MQYGCSIEIIYQLLKQFATECKFQGFLIWLSNSYTMLTIIGIPCSSFSRKLNISTDLWLIILIIRHFCSCCFSAVLSVLLLILLLLLLLLL